MVKVWLYTSEGECECTILIMWIQILDIKRGLFVTDNKFKV